MSGVQEERTPQEEARLLLAAYEQLSAPRDMGIGDLVVLRPGLNGYRVPVAGQPVIVTGFDSAAIETEQDSTTDRYKRPCDMRIGLIDPDDDFSEFWVDARHFMPYTPDGDS